MGGPTAARQPHTQTTDQVRLVGLTRTYGSGTSTVHALRGVRASFASGSFTAVMGPSGSGKSTLLQCAAGLDRPTSGQVFLGDREIGNLSENELTVLRRTRIGFVFQAFNLLPSLTAEQNVELPLRLAGRRPARGGVRDALARVGLAEQARRRPDALSGGQQQRVSLARALITRPDVLFADEPTGALDTNTSREVLELMSEVVRDTGMTLIMVTHDPVAASYADRVLFLVDGQVHTEVRGAGAREIADVMSRLEG
ncbi:ABC transporter ATP-binding protein [Actinoplanes lobatus]|uniref:ABC transporter ATP-binding protein n=1 Tax=Actinoplanes lobatus TaxID=113568 RepID=A0A7W7HN51_9ACTN|nr:ABC transporter ATP-binding protein [Actinoplanes lobatus]MBB4753551.1 putative ABC transport system ATP-binding protein [Actinoplanes lobatus]GGN84858.1 ABC transporter ATP-binding protein [Actinoplanes lobatus]GIE38087.1 ABC transporter ATP-binding protein [Actinoplanes lobatus]